MIIRINKVFTNKIQLRLSVSLCKYFGDGIKSDFGLKILSSVKSLTAVGSGGNKFFQQSLVPLRAC